jgi:hypothetical protein
MLHGTLPLHADGVLLAAPECTLLRGWSREFVPLIRMSASMVAGQRSALAFSTGKPGSEVRAGLGFGRQEEMT